MFCKKSIFVRDNLLLKIVHEQKKKITFLLRKKRGMCGKEKLNSKSYSSVFVFSRFTTDCAIVSKMNIFLWLLAALCVGAQTINGNVLDNLTDWKVSDKNLV